MTVYKLHVITATTSFTHLTGKLFFPHENHRTSTGTPATMQVNKVND